MCPIVLSKVKKDKRKKKQVAEMGGVRSTGRCVDSPGNVPLPLVPGNIPGNVPLPGNVAGKHQTHS